MSTALPGNADDVRTSIRELKAGISFYQVKRMPTALPGNADDVRTSMRELEAGISFFQVKLMIHIKVHFCKQSWRRAGGLQLYRSSRRLAGAWQSYQEKHGGPFWG